MFLLSFLFKVAPMSGSMIDLFGGNPITRSYYRWWSSTRERLIAFHRQELNRLDGEFAMCEAESELVSARIAALDGAAPGPLNPEVLKLMGPGTLV